MNREKNFTVSEDYIKLEGITSNPNLFCLIDPEALLAGERTFPCSVGNISYQLSVQDTQLAMYMAVIPNTKTVVGTKHN